MRLNKLKLSLILSISLLSCFLLCGFLFWKPAPVQDFTFIQITDVHTEARHSADAPKVHHSRGSNITRLPVTAPIDLAPYNTQAPAPSFIIVTGDFTEYGVAGVTWQDYLDFFKHITIPVYTQLGNHDNTWVSAVHLIRKMYGGRNYSFDKFGCHFIGLDSSTLQEPLPSFAQETLRWLKRDLKRIDRSTPVFVFFHHPLDAEFSSNYERYRLLDLLRPYNVVLLLFGHGHKALTYNFDGISGVMGGSTFGQNAGYNVVSVKDGVLRVVYKCFDDSISPKPLLEKPIPKTASYPNIKISSPRPGTTCSDDTLLVKAKVGDLDSPIIKVICRIDDATTHVLDASLWTLSLAGLKLATVSSYTATLPVGELSPGAHYLRIAATTSDGATYYRSSTFYLEHSGEPRARWRLMLDASIQSTPAIANGVAYVGANDGNLYAVRTTTGRILWEFPTGAEILSSPLVVNDTVYFGSGDATVYAVSTKGTLRWAHTTTAPIYAPPTAQHGMLYIGNNDARLCALDAETGSLRWVYPGAHYSIESQPVCFDHTVVFGAWDAYVYAVNALNGALRWRELGPTSSLGRAARYYSAADCSPVAASGKVYVADRGFRLARYDHDGSNMKVLSDDTAAISLSRDRKALYLRKSRGKLEKIDLQGQHIWEAPITLGRIPVPPLEKDGVLYACSNTGLLSAVDAATGKLLWQYQATPRLLVLAGVAADQGLVIVPGMDGSLTAIAPPNTLSQP
jgi:outer membrane protein assembly factor BamB/3',5'-cyclic AMP phosphodiesterase CpdA